MSNHPTNLPKPDHASSDSRCPSCDSVVPEGAEQCIMCGTDISAEQSAADQEAQLVEGQAASSSTQDPPDRDPPEVFEAVMRESKSGSVLWLAIAVGLITLLPGVFF